MARLVADFRDRARDLRHHPTDAEARLWSILRGKQLDGFRFRRQHPVPPYVLDFACVAAKLALELDGGQHGGEADARRDRFLAERGWRVQRFWSNEVLAEPESVADVVLRGLREPPPQPSPTLRAGEGVRTRFPVMLPPPPQVEEGRGEGSPRPEKLPRATTIAHTGTSTDTITLDHDSRHRRRRRLTTNNGLAFLLDLPEPRRLHDGDLLHLDDGRLIRIRAAPEPVADLRCRSPLELARLAWHIGNRHAPAQVLDGALRIRRDHVLIEMARRFGAEVVELDAPFEPESGAYAVGHQHLTAAR